MTAARSPSVDPLHLADGPAPSSKARSKLAAYLDLLAKWNRVYNLTSIRDRAQMNVLHVEDALAVLPWLPSGEGARLLDIGSGGGIPGIPLAIVRPDWDVVLVEANTKKAAFLTQVAIELALANVRVEASRIEQYRSDKPFNILIARAFSDLSTFVQLARPHLAPGGVIAAMKGLAPNAEIEALPVDIVVTGVPALRVLGVDAARHLVLMQLKGDRG